MADSRYRLPNRADLDGGTNREVYVGWDSVLSTYYAEVWEGDPEHEITLVAAAGQDIADITNPAGVIDIVRPYAQIPDGLEGILAESRNSPHGIVDDLTYLGQRHIELAGDLDIEINRMYSASGYVTPLERGDVDPVVTAQGWEQADYHLTQDGHRETFRRGNQELALNWVWSNEQRPTTRLATPVSVDGVSHPATSRSELAAVLADGSSDGPGPSTIDDQLDDGRSLRDSSETTSHEDPAFGAGDSSWDGDDDDSLGEGDDGPHTGLGL